MSNNICDTKVKSDNNISQNQRRQLVLEGIELVLSLFGTVGQQRLFPRKIMTKYTKGQITVYSKEQIIYWFEAANYHDCRINAYPTFISEAEEQDYKQGINLNLFAPNILFIDLDTEHFKSKEELDRWLKRILRNIVSVLHGVKPLVLWSGNGYHIIVPVKATEALEQFDDFEPYTSEPSKEFLQFAARQLSLNKSDTLNSPAFKSCLLRVPYTLNSKCIDLPTGNYIKDPEVKIIQQFDSLAIPTINKELLREFRLYLADKDIIRTKTESIKRSNQIDRYRSYSSANVDRRTVSATYQWIEKLLQTPIADHRKHTIDLVLASYLIVIKGLSFEESYSIIKDWIVKCNRIEMLKPSIEYFYTRIKAAINNSILCRIPPILQENMKKNYPDWHSMLKADNIISDY